MIDTDQQLTAVFNSLDEGRLGLIDESEFFAGLSQFVTEAPFDVAKALFRMIDRNDDKKISLEEFKELVHFYVKNQDDDDEYSVLFKKCNVNGFIDLENVFYLFKAINSNTIKDQIILFAKECDLDNDGKLNYEEYLNCALKVRYN